MHFSSPAFALLGRRLTALVVAFATTAGLGCAGPLGNGWADFDSDKRLAAAVADDSIPPAAEVGLAADSTQPEGE